MRKQLRRNKVAVETAIDKKATLSRAARKAQEKAAKTNK